MPDAQLPAGWPLRQSRDASGAREDEKATLGTRVEYAIVNVRGVLADSVAVHDPNDKHPLPTRVLAASLGVDAGSLLGIHYTCLVSRDPYGTTRSDYRLRRSDSLPPQHCRGLILGSVMVATSAAWEASYKGVRTFQAHGAQGARPRRSGRATGVPDRAGTTGNIRRSNGRADGRRRPSAAGQPCSERWITSAPQAEGPVRCRRQAPARTRSVVELSPSMLNRLANSSLGAVPAVAAGAYASQAGSGFSRLAACFAVMGFAILAVRGYRLGVTCERGRLSIRGYLRTRVIARECITEITDFPAVRWTARKGASGGPPSRRS